MINRKLILSLLILISFVSCKEGEQKTEEKVAEESKIDNLFTITLNATVLKDDSFQLFYREASSLEFSQEKSLFVEFKGSEMPQDIVFKLPEDVIPEFIRLDFGVNKEQSPIKINSFKLNYLDKSFETKGAEFFNYMIVEELTMKVDRENSTVTPFESNGSYDPLCSSEIGLKNEIQKLVY